VSDDAAVQAKALSGDSRDFVSLAL